MGYWNNRIIGSPGSLNHREPTKELAELNLLLMKKNNSGEVDAFDCGTEIIVCAFSLQTTAAGAEEFEQAVYLPVEGAPLLLVR